MYNRFLSDIEFSNCLATNWGGSEWMQILECSKAYKLLGTDHPHPFRFEFTKDKFCLIKRTHFVLSKLKLKNFVRLYFFYNIKSEVMELNEKIKYDTVTALIHSYITVYIYWCRSLATSKEKITCFQLKIVYKFKLVMETEKKNLKVVMFSFTFSWLCYWSCALPIRKIGNIN